MSRTLIILTVFVTTVYSDCVRYTFDDDFNDLFRPDGGFCNFSHTFWNIGYYNTTSVTGPNVTSPAYITPPTIRFEACASSFSFPMSAGGIVELNVYMANAVSGFDGVTLLTYQILDTGESISVGYTTIRGSANFVDGWYTLRVAVRGAKLYEGYFSVLGRASARSAQVFVDSFRYVGPSFDEKNCRLIEDDVITTKPTTNPPTTELNTTVDISTTASTLEEVGTTELAPPSTEPTTDLTTTSEITEISTEETTTARPSTSSTAEPTTSTAKPEISTTPQSTTTTTTSTTTETATSDTTTESSCSSCQKSITFIFFKMLMK